MHLEPRCISGEDPSLNSSLHFGCRDTDLKLPRMALRRLSPEAGSRLTSVDQTCTFISSGAFQKALVKIMDVLTSALLKKGLSLYLT